MLFGPGLGLDGGEKLSRHHLRRALNHSLPYACDCSAYLHISAVVDYGRFVTLFEVEDPGPFQKARLSFAIHNHPEVTRRLHFVESDVPGKDALD